MEKTEAEAALLAEQLTANPLFCTFTPDELRRAVEVMARQHIAADQIVARQGEAEATFFLLQSGSCSMTYAPPHPPDVSVRACRLVCRAFGTRDSVWAPGLCQGHREGGRGAVGGAPCAARALCGR